MFVSRVAVVGAQAVGAELAQAVAAAGLPVVLADADPTVLSSGLAHARDVTAEQSAALVRRGKLDAAAADAQTDAVLARLTPGEDWRGLGDVDLVIEATPDDLERKRELFAALDAAVPGRAILATTTATLSVAAIGAATTRPGQVVGLHPATARTLEVVEGHDTTPETLGVALRFAQAIRRTPIRCRESPGLVVGRVVGAGEGDPQAQVDGEAEDQAALRRLVEACRVVEAGVAGVRDVDTGVALGAGLASGPFAAADAAGLDVVLGALEEAAERWGEAFRPPVLLRRLVAQGRTGRAAGQGFYPHPRPDAGYEEAAVRLETRGDVAIAWLANPPANSISPSVVASLEQIWATLDDRGAAALVIASANPALFCAGADIREFGRMDRDACAALLESVHALLDGFEASGRPVVAAVNGLALGGGCELAMACDIRLAARTATFGQPEVDLGLIPGFGGTQRLPRLVGRGKAAEMNLTGEPITADDAARHGLVHRVVPDHELFDAALDWAAKLAGQAPVAIEQIKQIADRHPLADGLKQERRAFLAAFGSADAAEGIDAFLAKRPPRWSGR